MKIAMLTLIVIAVFIVFFTLAIFAFRIFFTVNPKLPQSVLAVGSRNFPVEIAATTSSRARGLSGREKLDSGAGMFFRFDKPSRYGFWMRGMNFPLDLIWIRDGRVIALTENISPEKKTFGLKIYYPPDDVTDVLEINAGEAKTAGIKIGDEIKLEITNGKSQN